MRRMSQINLDALRQAPLQPDPFDFLVAPGFIGPEALACINADYPPIASAANHNFDNLTCGPAFKRLMDALLSLVRIAEHP